MLLLEVISGEAPSCGCPRDATHPAVPLLLREERGLYQLQQHCAGTGLFWGAAGTLKLLSLSFSAFGPQGSGYLSRSGAR